MESSVDYPGGKRADGLPAVLSDPECLLPPVLRPPPGLDAAARYLPATAGGESVTGDFYDLFQARGPWYTAVMGDVCGKGTEAAKVTALARYTLRADAGNHLSPATVLNRLNAAMLAQDTPLFLTAALTARHGGWASDDTALLALRLPPDQRAAEGSATADG